MDNGQMYVYNGNVNIKNGKSRRFKIIVAVSIIAVILAVTLTIILICVFNSDEYKQKNISGAVELYFDALNEADYAKYYELLPPYWKKYMKADQQSGSKTQFRLNVEKYGCKGSVVKYEIKDADVVSDRKVSEINQKFEGWYNMTDKISRIVYLDIEMKVKNGTVWSFNDLTFVEIDGTWYLGKGYDL